MSPSPPSIAACIKMMEEYNMLNNIREHSFVVAHAAEKIHTTLALKLGRNALPSLQLLLAGALLHDIAKTQCLQRKCDHAEVGAEICRRHGYLEVAEIVAEHVRLLHYHSERYKRGVFYAKEIVFYADKRVMHDRIVGLPERLDYILERYGNNDEKRRRLIRHNFNGCKELENWLCSHAGVSPENLLKKLEYGSFT